MKSTIFKYLLLLSGALLCALSAFAEEDKVTNVTAHQKGQYIVIEYDLASKSDVTAFVSVEGGEYVKLTNVTGDLGAGVAAGHCSIVWDVLSQYESFNYNNVTFKIDTDIQYVKDICGNTYSTVVVGKQTWMVENMRCRRYDTESEAYKNSIFSIPEFSSDIYSSYFAFAVDSQTIEKGYLYSWAAAVGVSDMEAGKTKFSRSRQGICPNGWHVPTSPEWNTLYSYVDGGKNSAASGKKLKENISVLPAGMSLGNVGQNSNDACFWTASSLESDYTKAFCKYITSQSVYRKEKQFKGYAMSVRCVKNSDADIAAAEAERKAEAERIAEAERQAKEEAERQAKLEAEQKAREEAELKARKAKEEQKQAFTSGVQGSSDGNYGGVSAGSGTDSGSGYNLQGRKVIKLQRPDYRTNIEGKIVVEIEVDQQGNVVSARAGAQGTTINDYSMRKGAEQAALKTKFTSSATSGIQTGTITYRYKLE